MPDIIRTYSTAVVDTMKKPAIKDRISGTGLDAISSSPQEMAKTIAEETKKWERVVREAKITAG